MIISSFGQHHPYPTPAITYLFWAISVHSLKTWGHVLFMFNTWHMVAVGKYLLNCVRNNKYFSLLSTDLSNQYANQQIFIKPYISFLRTARTKCHSWLTSTTTHFLIVLDPARSLRSKTSSRFFPGSFSWLADCIQPSCILT